MKNRVNVHSTHLSNAKAIEDPDAFRLAGYDNSFSLEDFQKNFTINVLSREKDTLIFEMIGVSAPIVNALRRIFISDVPTLAIDTVVMLQNTSIMQDEVLAHRLGLIPLLGDIDAFEYRLAGEELNEHNATVFVLDVSCTENPGTKQTDPPHIRYKHSTVYASDLVWVPQGTQAQRFEDAPIRPVFGDIPILKLRPGQTVQAELHVMKGTGRVHAKWSPVATAFYRQMPAITITEEMVGDDAKKLVETCPMNVFDIEDIGKKSKTVSKAVVRDPYNCTMCRECVRDPELEKKVKLQRVRDHYIFTIESAGQLTPEDIFRRGIREFKTKLGLLYLETQKVQQDV